MQKMSRGDYQKGGRYQVTRPNPAMSEQTVTPKALSGTAKHSNVPYGTLQALTEEKISYQQRLLKKGFCNLV